jgi:hypothetical protein
MGESHRGQRVRKYETSPRTTPNQAAQGTRLGYDHCEVSLPSLRTGGDARSLNEAPSCSTRRPIRAGITSHAPAGSEFDLVGVL